MAHQILVRIVDNNCVMYPDSLGTNHKFFESKFLVINDLDCILFVNSNICIMKL